MAWRDAVWESDLPATVRLVALAFADHANDDGTGVYVVLTRLMARTGLSRAACVRSVAALRDGGWLATVRRASQHRAPEYDLIPQGAPSEHSRPVQGAHTDNPGGSRVLSDGAQGALSEPQPPTNPLQDDDVARARDLDPVVVVVNRFAETYQTVRGLPARGPLLDRVAVVARDNLAKGAALEVLLSGVPEAALRDEPWIDRYTLARRPSRGPVSAEQWCPTHAGQPAGSCAGCRADALAAG
jgi:hypothetical protein